MSVTISEASVQLMIVEGLRALGYLVEVTSRQRKRCPHCDRYSSGGDGASKGLADLMIGRASWGAARMALEVKGSKTPLSTEQTQLYECGMICVARSWEDALDHLVIFEAAFSLPSVAAKVS